MRKLLCIIGPTASGKTALSIEAARQWDGEIVSCDSVQIYKGFDIGSAKPTLEERAGIPHHMLDVANPTEQWSAGRYAEAARAAIAAIEERGGFPIVCGGTGLYLRALLGGLHDIPAVPRGVYGEDAYEILCRVDPETASKVSPRDIKRVGRTLDVYYATGKPLSEWQGAPKPPLYDAVYVGILPGSRRENIEKRTDEMLKNGLIEETGALLQSGIPPDCPPMRSIGYKQACAVLLGGLTRPEARDEIVLRTLQYAKRQMTWFRNQTQAHWLSCPENLATDPRAAERFLKNAIKTMETLCNI